MCDERRTFRADEMQKMVDRLQDQDIPRSENVPGAVEAFAEAVVEEGTFWPDCTVTVDIPLSLRARLTGTQSHDVSAAMCIGMVLGTALERDVPIDTALEDAWRDGAFELPEGAPQPESDR